MSADWAAWIGRSETRDDILTPGLLARFRATIDSDDTGKDGAQGIHWCLGLPDAPTAALGPDGHPVKGGFLPPIALPRRMWASSSVAFHAPIRLGDAIERVSRIAGIEEKQGGSGRLVFVTLEHETRAGGVLAVNETQSIVYREAPPPGAAISMRGNASPDEWPWRRTVTPTAPMLFRYSALTFNSHRIHYDRPYATGEEGYPGLVVHGPLTATLLLDLAARQLGPNRLKSFTFRGVAPAFAGTPLDLVGRETEGAVELAAIDANGRIVMTATGAV